MLGLQYFSFDELWSPWFFFFMTALVILYFYLAGPWKEKHAPQEPKVTGLQKTMFVSGMVFLYLALGGPLQLLGHMMFTFHMVNMSLAYLIAPPLLLLGIPAYMWRRFFRASFWSKLGWTMHPIFTLVFFNMIFSVYHVPDIHDYVMLHFTIHRIFYLVLFITSMMMWWQIACPVPEWNRLTDLRKMAYIFASGMLLTPACALIIFSGSTMYATYSDPDVWAKAMGYCIGGGNASLLLSKFSGPSFFNLLSSPAEDQQLGGIVMKLVQELMYGCILAYVFFQWYKKEHGDAKDDEIPDNGALN
ncbi:cytochrome c oxidase assembly factor CtaG [Paenibacillus rhizovicinus]|uniref:Cytochrome c oxidase assembly factor CtaG n=1 Tax=Paenibacillus rhizovicinus TaxID=2704463 RepID=A0A6C0NYF6_9BACL|nr:cytochrome c oxidase assembly factor CtaG [Paenibacillus rhizovicinus]QHW31238.1 cytochrome c oxidase assembly factor CtaG [Paenibacillus rhizovicinus]